MKKRLMGVFAALCLSLSSATSTTFTWTATSGGPLTDGSGTWNFLLGANWFNSSTGTYGLWGFATDTAVFGVGNGSGSANIDIVHAQAGSIVFNPAGTGSYNLFSSTFSNINMGGSSPSIVVNADARIDVRINVYNTGLTVMGSGSLYLANVFGGKYFVQAGTGTTTLSGPADGYFNGPVTITAGTLRTGSGLGIIDNDVSISSAGTLSIYGNPLSVSALSGSGTVENGGANAATLTLKYNSSWSTTTSSTFSGTIRDGGPAPISLTLGGRGTLTLSDANTYTGTTTIGAGGIPEQSVLRVTTLADGGSPSSIGASSNAASNLVISGGILQYAGAGISTDRLFTLGMAFSDNPGGIDSSGTGPVNFTNHGAILLSPLDSYQSILTLTGTNTGNNTLSAAIGSTAGIWKQGTGTWVLGGSNTYTGSTQVDSGILAAGAANAFGTCSPASVAAGATLRLNGYSAGVGALTGGGVVDNSGTSPAILTVEGGSTMAPASSNTFSGAIQDGPGSGSLSLIKAGTGFQVLSGNNSYSGPTSVNEGVLQFANTNALYGGTRENWTASNLIVKAGATLSFNVGGAGEFTSSDVTAFTQLSTATGGFLDGSNIGLDASHAPGASFLHAGDIASSNGGATSIGVTVSGSGTVTLSGNNTYTGATNVNGGMLVAGSGSAFGNNSPTIINSGGLSLNGFSASIGSLAGDGSIVNGSATAVTLTVGTDNSSTTFSGNIWDGGGGALAFTKTGAGMQTLSGFNFYSGATTVSGGTLNVTGYINGPVTVNSGAKLIIDSPAPFDQVITLNGAGPGGRSILGGTGTINTAIILNNLGSTLSPGNSPGVLTFGSSQEWNSFSLDWETNNFTGNTPGADFDQVIVAGSLNLTGGAGSYVLNILSLMAGNVPGPVPNFSEISQTWNIITGTAGITGFDAANWTVDTSGFTSDPSFGGTFALGQSGNNIELGYTPVPEPASLMLVAGAALIYGMIRRRK